MSKNQKLNTILEIERLQKRVNELEKIYNSYDEVLDAFVEGFVMDLYSNDIIKVVDLDVLQTWFSNPDEYMSNITTLLTYYYIVDGNIFQLYDLLSSLPSLDYKITPLVKDKYYEEDLITIKRYLERKVRHKELTRDLLAQLASKGTVIGTWLGNKEEPYFYVFEDLQYVYPYGRAKGKMVAVIDLQWLDDMNEEERELVYQNLSPLVTARKYKRFKDNTKPELEKKLRYVVLPPDKTLVARIHTLNRNQRLGIPFGTPALFDMQHKQKLKDLERAIANKIIRAIAVLKFRGRDDNDNRVKASDKKKVFSGVKKALEKNASSKEGITCIAIPDFADFTFPEIKNGDKVLDPSKYEGIDNDITTAIGISNVLMNGTKSNYASAKLNLDIVYKKISIMLEKIEEIYNQLITIILGERGENYIFEYNKETPLTKAEKVDILMKLHRDEGFSLKYVIDHIDGIDWQSYIEQSLYEQEVLKLPEKIKPYKSSYTTSGEAGRPSNDDSDNENTISSKEHDGNNSPKE